MRVVTVRCYLITGILFASDTTGDNIRYFQGGYVVFGTITNTYMSVGHNRYSFVLPHSIKFLCMEFIVCVCQESYNLKFG